MTDNCQVVPHSNSSQRYLIIFDYRVKIWFYAVGFDSRCVGESTYEVISF